MLSEKQVEQTIRDYVQQPSNMLEEMDYQEGVRQAAHAIAAAHAAEMEEMREELTHLEAENERLRKEAGEPKEPVPIAAAFAELAELIGHHFKDIDDVAEYVRRIRRGR